MKRFILLSVLVVSAASLSLVAAQPPAASGPKVVDIQKLKDNLYVLTSSSP